MVLNPNREPMSPEKWERVKAQVRDNMRRINLGRAKELGEDLARKAAHFKPRPKPTD